jgi:hypothetical protein
MTSDLKAVREHPLYYKLYIFWVLEMSCSSNRNLFQILDFLIFRLSDCHFSENYMFFQDV